MHSAPDTFFKSTFVLKIFKSNNLPIITLTTDFGTQSHFVAELKGKLSQIVPQCQLVDVTHAIAPYNLTEAAFILKNSVFHFPPNTLHAVGVDSSLDVYKALIVAQKKDQFLIAADNGIVPMVFEEGDFSYRRIVEESGNYFSFKNSFPQYLKILIDQQFNLDALPGKEEQLFTRTLQKPVYKDHVITFSILYIDAFGNAYTTLTEQFFREFVGSKKFKIHLSRFEFVEEISTNYADVNEGEKVCFFDENGYMVIAINRGRANQLLGLKRDTGQLLVEIFD